MSGTRRRSARIHALEITSKEELERAEKVNSNRKRMGAQARSVEPKKKTTATRGARYIKSATTPPTELSGPTTPKRFRAVKHSKNDEDIEEFSEVGKVDKKKSVVTKQATKRSVNVQSKTAIEDAKENEEKKTPPSRPRSSAQTKRVAALKLTEGTEEENKEVVNSKKARPSIGKGLNSKQHKKIDFKKTEQEKAELIDEDDNEGQKETENSLNYRQKRLGRAKSGEVGSNLPIERGCRQTLNRKATPLSDRGSWIDFGNSSDDEERQLTEEDHRTRSDVVSRCSSSGRPQRAKAPKSFVFKSENIEGFSSSSEDNPSSLDEEDVEYGNKASRKSSSDSEDLESSRELEGVHNLSPDESDGDVIGESTVSEKRKRMPRMRESGCVAKKSGGKGIAPHSSCRPSTRVQRYRSGCDLMAKDTERFQPNLPHHSRSFIRAKTTSLSGPALLAQMQNREMIEEKKSTSSVRIEELKKRAANHVTTITAGQRKESRGEKIMRELKRVAQNLAINRADEVSTEECAVIMAQLKEQYKKGSSTRSAYEKEAYEVKPKGDDGSSSSEDEWEEMEFVEEEAKKSFEVTIDKSHKKAEVDWAVKWLKCEVNKSIREAYENAHRMHIICWLFYLQFQVKCALDEELVTSLVLSQMPSGFSECRGNPLSETIAEKFVKWMQSAFKLTNAPITLASNEFECRYSETARYAKCVNEKYFETDLDRAMMFFVCFAALEVPVRLVCNCRVMEKKITSQEKVGKKSLKSKCTSKKSGTYGKTEKVKEDKRDFWIEWWSMSQKKWISVDPVTGEIDLPSNFEQTISKPALYIFACDDKLGIRDVGARYLSSFATPDYRRNRTQQDWIGRLLKIPLLRANAERARLEDLSFQNEIAMRPLPKSLAEYKNHPLYVLEKDLLKFEAIYPHPKHQKPIGELRGHKIYPRSTVYTLQGELNWVKLARSIKKGELPYKVVKARPNMRIPADQRGEPKDLNVYGFWQTEPYRTPEVIDGKIPRNEYGNIYIYQDSMVPEGTVHLKMNGIINICRRLDKEHVPVVVGWDFHGSSNHPIIEGACVLECDVEQLIVEWEKAEERRKEREKKKRLENILNNWKKLIRGALRLQYMNKQFGHEAEKEKEPGALPNEHTEIDVQEENDAAWPASKFTLQNIEEEH